LTENLFVFFIFTWWILFKIFDGIEEML